MDSISQLQRLGLVVTVIWIVRGVVCSVDSDSQLQPLRLVVTVMWIVRRLCVLWIVTVNCSF